MTGIQHKNVCRIVTGTSGSKWFLRFRDAHEILVAINQLVVDIYKFPKLFAPVF